MTQLLETSITRRLGLRHPLVQAPLAGGGDTTELVAAVCNAGGLGFIGAAYLTPEQIVARARAVTKLTTKPFGINLFAPQPTADLPPDAAEIIRAVSTYHGELGLVPPVAPQPEPDPFPSQLEAVLQTDAAVFSFTMGTIPRESLQLLKERMYVIGTATTVEEALVLEKCGVDAVVAQGSEAGGHRATFLAETCASIGTLALVPQTVDAVSVPVIASGGIMDGRGFAASLVLGAAAVQIGTAFLTSDEAGVPAAYRTRLLSAKQSDTRLTRAFSGREARGIVNRVMEEIERSSRILPFPLQNQLTRQMRAEAGRQGRAEYLSLWAGQGVGLARSEGAAELIERITSEARRLLDGQRPGLPPATGQREAGSGC